MKRMLFVLFLGFALAACEQKHDEVDALRQRQDQNVQVVQEMFAHFNKHDWEAMAAKYADQAEFRDPALGTAPVMRSRADIVAQYLELHKLIPDVQDEIKNIFPAGERQVVVEIISSGTDVDGKPVFLPMCSIFTINEGQITADYMYYDRGCNP